MLTKIKDAYANLFNSELDLEERLNSGTELCELLESVSVDSELKECIYEIFVNVQHFLTETQPQFIKESPVQRLRHICLEILQKIRNVDFFKPYAPSLISLLFKLIEHENEENVLLCIKLIIDLHKSYRPQFSSDVTQFLVFVQKVYRSLKGQSFNIFRPQDNYEVDNITDLNVEMLLQSIFTPTPVKTKSTDPDGNCLIYHILPKSCLSLRVMQEIPILVVLMYQLFKQQIHHDVSEFIPLIMEFINMKPLPEQRLDPAFRQDKFIDFLAAQVKTLSFLAYVIKIYQDLVEQHSGALVKGMMNLLVTCPPSVTNMRKEFFIAARHILGAQEIRPKFLPVLDDLMREDILIGQGYTVHDALRPLAYSTLADLTHHLRSELSLTKIARAIDLYGRNMFDDSLPFSIQQMSLKLLLNLVECIRQRAVASTAAWAPDSAAGGAVAASSKWSQRQISTATARRLLLQIMRLCVLKCQIIAEHLLPEIEAKCVKEDSESPDGGASRSQPKSSFMSNPRGEVTAPRDAMDTDDTQPNARREPFLTSEVLTQGQLTFTDLRALTKSLATGMRTVVTSLTQCPHWNSASPQALRSPEDYTATGSGAADELGDLANQPSPKLLQPAEVAVLFDYLTHGLRMLDVLRIVSKDGQLFLRGPQSGAKYPDERFLLETVAMTFVPLSPISFREIFHGQIGYIVEWCRKSPFFYTNFAFHLLSQLSQTSNFGYILLNFLVDRLEKLGDGTDESFIYMRLLKLCFNSVNMSGTENEHVMRLFLRRIVQGSMQYCLEAREPTAYLTLLRTLFRSIGGGAHDKLYREFFPLLPEMLTTLNRLLRSAHRASARDLLSELCVIVPVRLSALLPYLSLLMEPLIYVLNCNTVSQGLRTLELCVENMQPDFLYEHMYQVRGDMLLALYNSLHSQSEYVQKMAFKVLGKLGRYNRADIGDVQRLNLDVGCGEAGPLLRFWLTEYPSRPVDLPIRTLVDAAVEAVQDGSMDRPVRLRAWNFLKGVCIAALNLHPLVNLYEEMASVPYLQSLPAFPLEGLSRCILASDSRNEEPDLFLEDRYAKDINREVILRAVGGVFLAGAIQPPFEGSGVFMTFLIRQLTLVNLYDQIVTSSQRDTDLEPVKPKQSEGTISSDQLFPPSPTPEPSLDPKLVVDAICLVMGHEDKEHVCTGYVLLDEMLSTATATIRAALQTSHTAKRPCKNEPQQQQPQEHSSPETMEGLSERASKCLVRFQLLRHLSTATMDMLYHPAWYVKWGACCILLHLCNRLPVQWFIQHIRGLLRGLLHCLHDLSSQMGQGALNLARECALELVKLVFLQSVQTGTATGLEGATTTGVPRSVETATQQQALRVSLVKLTPSQPSECAFPADTDVEMEPKAEQKSPPIDSKTPVLREPSKRTAAVRRRTGQRKTPASVTTATSKRGSTRTISREPSPPDNQPAAVSSLPSEERTTEEVPSTFKVQELQTVHFVPSPLMNSVLPELVDALLSEAKAVRVEARRLLRFIAAYQKVTLTDLLKPYIRLISDWLPPKNRQYRLANLPISSQVAVIEANYFLCQPKDPDVTPRGPLSPEEANSDDVGASLLRYCPTRRCDHRFLIDLRAILDAPWPLPTAAGAAGTQTAPVLAFSGSRNQLGGGGVSAASISTALASQPPLLSSLHQQQVIDLKVAACRVLSTTHYIDSQKSSTLAALFKGICSDSPAIHKVAFDCTREFVSHTTIDLELRHTYVKPILQNIRQVANLRLSTIRQLAYCAELFPSTFSERFCDAIHCHLNAFVELISNRPEAVSKLGASQQPVELASALIDLFHLIPLATEKYVGILIGQVIRMEQLLNIELTSPLRLPLVRSLVRYPEETFRQFLHGPVWPYDSHAHRLLLFAVTCSEGLPLVTYLESHAELLADALKISDADSTDVTLRQTTLRLPRSRGPLTRACPRHLALRLLHTLHQQHPTWFTSHLEKAASSHSGLSCPPSQSTIPSSKKEEDVDSPPAQTAVSALLTYWSSAEFFRSQSSLTLVQLQQTVPGVDVEALLEEEHMNASAGSSNSSRKNSPFYPGTGPTLLQAESPAAAGVRISAGLADHLHWDEPFLILDCLLPCAESHPDNFDLLFTLVAGMARLRCVGYNPLRRHVQKLASSSTPAWHRKLLLSYISLVKRRIDGSEPSRKEPEVPLEVSTSSVVGKVLPLAEYLATPEAHFKLLAHLILPCVQRALEHSPQDFLLGRPPNPFEASDDDLVHLFVSVLLTDDAVNTCTGLRIMYYHLASLFIYYAPEFVHDVKSETQSYRLRSITSFAWPCVSSSLSVVDLQEKYTGLQVLAHLIAKFPVAKKAAPQVFQCLAKGTHIETKKIVNPVLDMLLPAWVTGAEELKALAFSTKKIMMEDHGIQSCVHILSLIVRNGDLYYPIRHHILSLIIVIITRLSAQQLPIDQRRLILDMIDTAFRWHQKSRAEANESALLAADDVEPSSQKTLTSNSVDASNTPMEKTNRDQLTNLMIRFACQSIDTTQNGTTSELSARRALSQIETTLSSDVWGGETCELRLSFLDRFLCPDEFSAVGASGSSGGQPSSQSQAATAGGTSAASAMSGAQTQQQSQSSGLGPTQSSSVFMTLEVLRVIYTTLESPTLLSNVKYFSKSVSTLLSTYPLNVRLTRACANLIRALLVKYPADASNRQKITSIPELVELYTVVLKTIHEALTFFGDNINKTAILPRLQSAFLLLTVTQQCPTNPYAFVDRCISQIVKLLHRLVHEVVTPTSNSSPQDNTAFSQLTDLLISGLDIVKSRLNVVSNEARKNVFGPDLLFIIERSKEAKLLRAVIRILRDWIDVPKAEEHFAPINREKVAFFSRLWMAVPRWSDQPDVVRDILDCIYQVFSNNSAKNHDIMVKLEQAFCCSLLTPLPDLREKFIDLYLTGSNLISLPLFGETGETTETSGPPQAESTADVPGVTETAVPTPNPVVKTDLLVRLLFLLVSNSWDEAHFKNGFWLPLFFDVLLCTTDFDKPTLIVQPGAKLCSPDAWSNKLQGHPVQIDPVFDPSPDTQPAPKPDSTEAPSTQTPLTDTDFYRLLDQQSSAYAEITSTSAKDTIRGMLNLVHRRPALATELFGQLWHCIWHRLLLNQSERRNLSSRDPPDVSQLSDTLADTVLSATGPLFSVDSSSLLSTESTSPTATSTVVPCLPLGNGTPVTAGSPTTIVSLSPGEIRGFLLPQLIRFLTSDEHVNPTEAPPSPLGSFISGLYTTPDSLLLSMPLPLLSYIGYAHNQWYAMALFFESLCARGYRALAYNGRNSSVDNDLTYSIGPAIDGSGAASGLPEDVPLGTAALSLVALYDCMSDPDHFVAAWWYRLNSNCAGNQRITSVDASATGISAIQDAESTAAATGLICPAVSHVCDFLRSLLAFSRGDLCRGLETATNLLVPCASTVGPGFDEENWRRSGVASGIESLSFSSPSPLSQPTGLSQFSELINKTRMQEYCIKTLKLLGQWENLESLAAASHSTLSPGNLTTSPVVGPTVGGASGNSALWGLRAEAAWRLNDWSEVYTSLAGLANECPRQDQWRFALIQAAACVAGRRAALGLGALDFDAYGAGTSSAGIGGSASTGGSSVSAPGSGATGGALSAAAAAAAASSAGGLSGLLQAAEGENHRVMLSILREWRCLPLIVSNQHVRLLQAFQRAIEVTEGNILLIQHCSQMLTASPGSAGVTPGAPSVTSAARTPYDYKTVIRSWLARPPLISDDLSFWSDLLCWRQVVFENIINCGASSHKFGQERTNLLTTCQRELALCQIQLARGYRKNRLPSLAQQSLDRYSHLNFPPLFEKTKQEIKLKLADLRKEELLEGLELMEKTNIQQFEKKDKARFFCYKAVFFSHFNKGDEATKNFGYATQMQDNLHKVWSVYGDFLENVYSSYPAAKREIAVSTTGIFAMQALMEAATVAGTSQHLSHSDLAKCIWLLTLDDAGDAFSASAESASSSVTGAGNTSSVLGQSTTSQQRLARTFEERAGRVHPDALLPWLPSLAVCLLRPEGRFVSGALRNLLLNYPTALYSALRGLQHQLTTEMERDRRIALALTNLSPESRRRLDEVYMQNSSTTTATSISSAPGNRPTAAGSDSSGQRGGGGVGSLSEASAADGGGGDLEMDYESCSGMSYVESSGRRSTVRLGTHDSEASAAGAAGKANSGDGTVPGGGGTSAAGPSSMHSVSLIAKRTKKRVVVVMRGAEGERLASSNPSASSAALSGSVTVSDPFGAPGQTMLQTISGAGSGVTGSGEAGPKPYLPLRDSDAQDIEMEEADIEALDDSEFDESLDPQGPRTGYLSPSVSDSLHRINLLFAQLRQRHPGRLFIFDRFVEHCAGRLLPGWAEHLHAHLLCLLSQLHTLAWAQIARLSAPTNRSKPTVSATAPGVTMVGLRQLATLRTPAWLAAELTDVVANCGLSRTHGELGSDDDELGAGGERGDSATTAPCLCPAATMTEGSQEIHPDARTALPAFCESVHLACSTLHRDALADPYFHIIRKRLVSETATAANMSVLELMSKLTRDWLPLVERRISLLPATVYLTDCGSGRLIELIATSGSQSLYGPFLRTVPGSPCQPTSTTTTAASNLGSFVAASAPLLHLPGDTVRFKTVPVLVHVPNFSATVSGPSAGCWDSAIGGSQQSHLHIADVLPTLLRVRSSATTNVGGQPARRLALRASNGRLFFYDLGCMPRDLPTGSAVAAPPLASETVVDSQFLAPALRAYVSARKSSPMHIFQVLNDLAARQPETAKRQLSLVVPRSLEIGPHGMHMVQVGPPAPAANVVAAHAVPRPTIANAEASEGALLALLAQPPPAPVSLAVPPSGSGTVGSSGTTSFVTPASAILSPFPQRDAFVSISDTNDKQALGTASMMTTAVGISSNYTGSRGVAAEVAGRPAGLDAGCQAAAVPLVEIVDSAALSLRPVSTSLPPPLCRDLVVAYFERLLLLVQASPEGEFPVKASLSQIFWELLRLVAPGARLHTPAPSRLGVLSEEFNGRDGFSGASALRLWAFRRFSDAESYWLFRRGVALHCGTLGLAEVLFNLTPLRADCLLIEPRAARLEAHNYLFDLPTAAVTARPLQQKDLSSGGSARASVSNLHPAVGLPLKPGSMWTKSFASVFAPLTSRPGGQTGPSASCLPAASAFPSNAAVVGGSFTPLPRPVPFRLTPQLCGLLCPPGVPATIGPLAASMHTLGQALASRRSTLLACLRTLLRDDYILWHRGRQAAIHACVLADVLGATGRPMDARQGLVNAPELSNERLIQLITLTTDAFNQRIRGFCDGQGEDALNELINAAHSVDNLAFMDPSWLPWI